MKAKMKLTAYAILLGSFMAVVLSMVLVVTGWQG